MILEVADIRVKTDQQSEFEQAAHHGIQTVIARSKGFRGYQVRRSIESPDRYLLLLEWDTLEDHTVGFRSSAAYAQWRTLVVDFFAQPPFVEHFAATRPSAEQQTDKGGPVQEFSDCHVGIRTILDELTALAATTDTTASRPETAGRVLRFFSEVVTAHHQEEESELFTAVLADATAGSERSRVESLIRQLTDEHRSIEHSYSTLVPSLLAIEQRTDAAVDAEAVSRVVDRYRAHAQLEETEFLPLAREILGRNSDHLAALGLSLHMRHTTPDIRRKFGAI